MEVQPVQLWVCGPAYTCFMPTQLLCSDLTKLFCCYFILLLILLNDGVVRLTTLLKAKIVVLWEQDQSIKKIARDMGIKREKQFVDKYKGIKRRVM